MIEQRFNVVDPDIISRCIEDYNSREVYITPTMNKTYPGNSLGPLQQIIENVVGRKLEYCTGNFYKHSIPYLPHTDYKSHKENTLNVVIPLSYTGTKPHLVVFDQVWTLDSVTWCMHHPVYYFESNIGVKGCPYEYPVEHLTDSDIDEILYKEHLSHYPKETLKGLSGKAYPFEVGSVIIFDNRKIHCTSNFKGEKLGISLRFKS
jgi:hypothetical protein